MRNSGASLFYIPGLPTVREHLYGPKTRDSGDELTLNHHRDETHLCKVCIASQVFAILIEK